MSEQDSFEKYTYKIERDPEPPCPDEMEDDNAFFCAEARRYYRYVPKKFGSRYVSDIEKELDESGDYYTFPVYAYIHSGITVSMKGFSCPFDSGQTGFYAVAKAEIAGWSEEFRSQHYPGLDEEGCARAFAEARVKGWDKYFNGDYYGYNILEHHEYNGRMFHDIVESCYGFDSEEDAEEAAKECIEHLKSEEVSAENTVLTQAALGGDL